MTIKRRLFFSNIRMALVTIGGFILTSLAVRIIFYFIMDGVWWGKPENHNNFSQYKTPGWFSLFFFISAAVFILFICTINILLTHRMSKKIIKPLEILTAGVKQIHENNFAYRIEYNEEDEYRMVCEAFNQMAAQLEASTEMRLKDEANRRELLAGISHDLRTPLTTITGYLDGIESGVASTPEMREKYFYTIKNRAADMKHIIEQLFLFSKLDMGEYPFSPRRFVLIRTLSDMIEELAEEYAMRGLDVAINSSLENIFVYADVLYFRRVLVNLLENSAKYKKKETGRITISASLDNNFIQIKFSDDGPGVEPDMLPNLFNAFYRTDPSRHTKGSGLGLEKKKKIIELSGGTVYAENNDTGGLAIVIRLPVATGEA
jgi:signal transduction histidine kinase